MLFNYSQFIDSLRNDPIKRQCIERYERHIEPIGLKSLQEELWFVELVKCFSPVENFLYPSELQDDFDWKLLVQLGAASISSELGFVRPDQDIHLLIRVTSGDETVIKKVHELWDFQILRLFEIYVEEQINLCGLSHEDEEERKAIYKVKEFFLEKWNSRILELRSHLRRA